VNIGDDAPRRGLQPSALPEAVEAFLRRNPSWLAEHADLYALLDPPQRVHGERLADHMAALLLAARSRADHLAGEAALATAARRAAEGFAQRVQDAVLALMRAPDPAWCVQHDLPPLLRLDSARLCIEGGHLPPGIPPGTVAAVLGQRQALVRDARRRAEPLLHGEAAALAGCEALVRVPLRAGPALLALACRDGHALAGAATPTLAFLGQAVAAALDGRP